ncbi:hypothetical protein Cgig2_022304 [Carnegiea gigantea]|uniref:Uncharacterized protein n=1 Tax=Carnegiea gigantea TaxID=171969 RepID=A0A9Q1KHH4_9CARY|nr:hypothetical protein Cgig2_022304 [Carnegiea gigantea]
MIDDINSLDDINSPGEAVLAIKRDGSIIIIFFDGRQLWWSIEASGVLCKALQVPMAYSSNCQPWCWRMEKAYTIMSHDKVLCRFGGLVNVHYMLLDLEYVAYLYMRTKKKDVVAEEENTSAAAPSPPTSTATATATTVTEMPAMPVAQPLRAPEPIPEEQQRELFKWMLEEKRKIKTNDPEEKKRIDEEKAILKQSIRAQSIPKI